MPRKGWCQINAKAGGPVEILIYDVIGMWFMDTDALSVANQIRDLDTDEIRVRINSPGGDAFDGIAIYNALRSHPANVTVVVDGLAASAASVIAMAGDEIVMGTGSQMMIHLPWMFTEGDAGELRKDANRLDKMTDSLASIYAKQAGVGDWLTLMAAETWFTAGEAVSAGLATRVDEHESSENVAAAFSGRMAAMTKHFRFDGRADAPAPKIPSANVAEGTQGKEGAMSTLNESLCARLGVAEGADDDTIVAALDEALAEQTAEPQAEAKADIVADLAKRGMVAVDKATLAATEQRMAAGEQALERLDAMERAQIVQSHVDRGAITPAQRGHYEKLVASDRETTVALLDAMPANKYPVSELGHDADGVEGDKDNHAERLTASADKAGIIGQFNA